MNIFFSLLWYGNLNKMEYILLFVLDSSQVDASEQEWTSPSKDWRFVTERTLVKHIPFEKDVTLSTAIKHIREQLAQYKRVEKVRVATIDTPLWFMSTNQIRKSVYRAAISSLNPPYIWLEFAPKFFSIQAWILKGLFNGTLPTIKRAFLGLL